MDQYNTHMDQDKWFAYCDAWAACFDQEASMASGLFWYASAVRSGIVFG